MSRPTHAQLQQISDIVTALRSGSVADAQQLFEQYHRAAPMPPPATPQEEQEGEGHPSADEWIGIWKKERGNDGHHYRRDAAMRNDWHNWADVETFALRPGAKKIVFLGESVARGYLLDPAYNPAKILQHLLDMHTSPGGTQLIDLARSSMLFSELQALVRETAVLQPDMIVLFAGNNWDILSVAGADTAAYGEVMQLIASGNIRRRLMPLTRKIFQKAITSLFGELRRLHPRARVVVVVPGFNLLDWRSAPEEQLIPRMHPRQLREWINARDRALTALGQNRFEALVAFSAKLIELDHTNPLGYELMAQAALSVDGTERAGELLEAAKDLSIYGRNFTSKPRCFSFTQEILRRECGPHGFQCVDVPALLRQHLQGNLPGRELFFDYCHLSVKGMKLVCSAMAAAMLRDLAGRQVAPEALIDACPDADAATQAHAHFFAAVHNAHYGQDIGIVRYHCAKALEHDAGIAGLMVSYARLNSLRTDSLLCKAFRDMIRNGSLKQYRDGQSLLHPYSKKLLDTLMADAMIAVLSTQMPSLRGEIDELLLEQHGIGDEPEDLLQSYYSLFNFFVTYNQSRPYYRSSFDRSVFVFVTDAAAGCRFSITLRNGNIVREDAIAAFRLNGHLLKELEAGAGWKSHTVMAGKDLLRKGINTVEIAWPLPGDEDDAAGDAAVSSVEEWWREYYCSFGEIHCFNVHKTGDGEPANFTTFSHSSAINY